MSKKIDNEGQHNVFSSMNEFFLVQRNYPNIQEIVFFGHTTRDILTSIPDYAVAIFKVIPRKPMVITEAGELEAYETMYR